jgi:hypothetical protein
MTRESEAVVESEASICARAALTQDDKRFRVSLRMTKL